jgi:hypothetical protein
VAYGIIKDIKGHNIHSCLISNSPIEKSYDGCVVSPFIVAGGLPNLAMLSSRSPELAGRSSLFVPTGRIRYKQEYPLRFQV